MLNWVSVVLIFLSSALAATQQINGWPQALYLDCQGGGLSKVCENTIQEAWNAGKCRTFSTEHQFFTGSDGNCKVTCWTDSNYPVQLSSVGQVKAATQKIDEFCAISNLPIADPRTRTQGYKGVFVGKMGGVSVVIMLNGSPQ